MLSADARSLKNLGRELRRSRPEIMRATQRGLREVGQKVAEKAKENASWSSRIPQTIKPRVSGLTAVVVKAGGPSAPHAKPYEHAGAHGTFRHPVFGDRKNWVTEAARPFLHPAAFDGLQRHAEELARALGAQIEEHL